MQPPSPSPGEPPHCGDTPGAPCPPITSGARQRGCPAPTQHQPPRPGRRCHGWSPASPPQQSPTRTHRGPPRRAGSGHLRGSQGTPRQDRRLALEPPKPRYALITPEVTGLRGWLRRNRLLFTDTIWTLVTAPPFPARTPASVAPREGEG